MRQLIVTVTTPEGEILDRETIEVDRDALGMCIGVKNDLDLVNVPAKVHITGYINIYPDGSQSRIHLTRESADSAAANTGNRIACIDITRDVTEGEGL